MCVYIYIYILLVVLLLLLLLLLICLRRRARPHSYLNRQIGFVKEGLLGKHLPRISSFIKNESKGIQDNQILCSWHGLAPRMLEKSFAGRHCRRRPQHCARVPAARSATKRKCEVAPGDLRAPCLRAASGSCVVRFRLAIYMYIYIYM